MNKRIISMILAGMMVVSSCIPVLATESEMTEPIVAIEEIDEEDGVDAAVVADEVLGDTSGAVVASGWCGDNAQYTITGDATGGYTLTITGFGPMDTGMVYTWTAISPYVENIVKVIIPEGITTLGDGRFMNAKRLTQITIPNSVISIGCHTFEKCSSLKSISIGDNVTTLNQSFLFSGCTALETVRLPKGIDEIGIETFSGCTSLKNIQIGSTTVLANGSLQIPEGIKTIESHAFYNCAGIKSVSLPGTLEEIEGVLAFGDCTNLSTVYIGNVTDCSIGSRSFEGCINLTDITIPKGVSDIRVGVFAKCPKLTIHCYKDSVAHKYAVANGFRCVIIPEYSYSISFNKNGGKGTMKGISGCKTGQVYKLTPNKFKRDGYHFVGWNTNKSGKGTWYSNGASVTNLATKNGQKITLYAQWARNTYTIKFNANGGKGTMKSISGVAYGKSKKLVKNTFKKKGYVFRGWATSKKNAQKGKVAYKNKAKVKNLSKKNNATVTLYAVWKKK